MKNLTPDQLAKRWGVSANTIRAMCKRNELSFLKLGKLYRIPLSVVEEKEQCSTVSSNSEENMPSHGPNKAQRFDDHLGRIVGI